MRRPRRRRREVYVFAEGAVTEPKYVDQLKRCQSTFAVKVSDERGGPDKIVPLAVEHKRKVDRAAEAEGLPPEEWPIVWCMFDRDSPSEHRPAHRPRTSRGCPRRLLPPML